jgi:MFS family permease
LKPGRRQAGARLRLTVAQGGLQIGSKVENSLQETAGGEADTALRELRRAWPTLAGASWGLGFGALTIFFYTQGLFLGPLKQEFGWTRQQLSLVSLIGGFEIAGTSVLVGWLVDRFGVRGPALVAYVMVALAFAGLGMGVWSLPMFVLLQLLVIGFGAGNGPANYTRAINQSFDKARGLALGGALAGPGLLALVAPPVIAWVIQTYGWRAGYQAMALATAVSAPIVLGLLSFGGRRARPSAAARPALRLPLSLSGALRDRLFLRLLASFFLMAIGGGGLVLHMAPLLTDAGYDLGHAAKVQGLIGLSILFGRLGMGYLVDRIFAPWVAAGATTLAALGLFALAGFGPAVAPLTAVLIGLSLGAEGDIIGYVTARYFGLPSYGQLYGLLYGAYTVGLGVGPFLLALLDGAFGGYEPALWTAGGLLLAGAALLLGAPRFAAGAR